LAATTDVLVSRIRERAAVPDSGSSTAFGSTDQQILDLAHEIALTRLEPAIRSVRESYNVVQTDTALAAADSYVAIPRDAQASAVQFVCGLDSNSRTFPLTRSNVQEWVYLDPTATATQPCKYLVEGDRIHLWPKLSASGTSLRIRYFRRLSAFVPVSSCYPVASKTSTTIVVTGTPSGGTWSGTGIDVVQIKPPFRVLIDNDLATLSTSTFTIVGGSSTSEVTVGDYVCLHMETCVPGVPLEMHGCLASLTAAQLLSMEGDAEGARREQGAGERMLASALELLTPRVEEAPQYIINRSSPLRAGRRRLGRAV
jgi:hypothetical protein